MSLSVGIRKQTVVRAGSIDGMLIHSIAWEDLQAVLLSKRKQNKGSEGGPRGQTRSERAQALSVGAVVDTPGGL